MAKIQSKQTEVDGHIFDSQSEAQFYQSIKNDPNITNIELQPHYTLIENYKVQCKRCGGNGQQTSKKTGNWINCSLCKGVGKRDKQAITYTADFRITYLDGYEEVIDVKGSKYQTKDKAFRLRMRLFEAVYEKELVVIYPHKNEWVRM